MSWEILRFCVKNPYLFYRADDEFPAAVTCLYSHNAERFLPTDGLADVAEYTSKLILSLAAGRTAESTEDT